MRSTYWPLAAGLVALALATVTAGPVRAEGVLHLFNWDKYTSPELIARFEKAHDVQVTVTGYASPTEALEKIRAGGHGFDVMVVRSQDIPALIREGLLRRSYPNSMANFRNVARPWRNPPWDPWRRYSVPWQWGGMGIVVDGDVHDGEIGTDVIFEPPPELAGRIHVAADRRAVIGLARRYLGLRPCAAGAGALERLRGLLTAARAKWRSVGYGLVATMVTGDVAAALYWNEPARRARAARPSLRFAFPREGVPVRADELVVLKGAANVHNARLFLDFVMAPENAALLTAYDGQANAIAGSAEFLPPAMRQAPEIALPAEGGAQPFFPPACRAKVTAMEDALWDEAVGR
jgi:spermidine/putrescine transport system substrate-binding protein